MSGTELEWADAVLGRLGIAPTLAAEQALVAAAVGENSRAADNPDDTTQPGPAGTTNYNSAGVRNYPTWTDGVDETVATLSNGLYGPVLAALAVAGQPQAADRIVTAWARSPWGTWHGAPDPAAAAIATLRAVQAAWPTYAARPVAGAGPTTPGAPKEPAMHPIVVDGQLQVWYANPDGHLMRLTPNTADPSGWSVLDVTDAIAHAYPTVPLYLAAS